MCIFRFVPLLLAFAALAQAPLDLDDLGEGLDWSILSPPSEAAEAEHADRDLHAHLDALVPSPPFPDVPANSNLVQELELPGGTHWVVADPERIDLAYRRLAAALAEGWGRPGGPVYVTVHSDQKFSVALPLAEAPDGAMPLGLDLSPLAFRRFAGLWLTVPEARRDHPHVLAGIRRIRAHTESNGRGPQLAELYFFPGPSGMAFVALEIQAP